MLKPDGRWVHASHDVARLGRDGPKVSRIGLGLAAIGRPAYITTNRTADFGDDRSERTFRALTWQLLDAAYASGVRYVDVARSYGSAEEFLSGWITARGDVEDVLVGSKWGYTYVAGWDLNAPVQEVKDLTLATFERQYGETRALLGDHLRLYQVHSLTLESGVLENRPLLAALARLRADGMLLGITTTGTKQADTIRAALEARVDGVPVFSAVQATWNLLEPSAGPALSEAAAAGWAVIVKEVLANGRLTRFGGEGGASSTLGRAASASGVEPDALAIAAALAQPWASVVLSGAATVDQLASNLKAVDIAAVEIPDVAEPAEAYWTARSARPWT
ncbi:MAG TPA: aldo/keto reductase [Candidatus Saccharimonadales bacterium]|nr:aldo/keto reductase [Candidatus Saccharimonadales bacterium]